MKKLSVFTIVALVALCAASVPAMADIAYSNLGSPVNYNCCSGWTVGGANSPVGLVNDAEQFTSATTGNVSQIDVGLGWVTGGNPDATIQLWTSVGDLPGVMLGSETVTNLPCSGQRRPSWYGHWQLGFGRGRPAVFCSYPVLPIREPGSLEPELHGRHRTAAAG